MGYGVDFGEGFGVGSEWGRSEVRNGAWSEVRNGLLLGGAVN